MLADIEEVWHGLRPPYEELFAWLSGQGPRPDVGSRAIFRPLMLSHQIEDKELASIEPKDFVAEWKWDGIRVQAAHQGGEKRLFSRTGDDISAAFPDVVEAIPEGMVLDGELLVMREGEVAPFNDLQQRLNRKTVTAAMLKSHPAHIRLYDMLFDGGEDLRELPFAERRARLEGWHETHGPRRTDISAIIDFASIKELEALWAGARETGIEGLMLKRRDSPYIAGRPKGHWYKWKRAPLTIDAVLMYAQRGSGKRSSYYSDYTFGAWRDGEKRRGRAGAGRQVLFRLHRRGAARARPLGAQSHGGCVRPGAPGRAEARVRGGVRFGASLEPAQIRRRHALSPHPPHPLGQARGGSRPARDADRDDRLEMLP